MNKIPTPYEDLLYDVLHNGNDKSDRTGTGTRSIFGTQIRYNLQHGFPLLTTKKVFTKGIIHELIWFLSGSTNIQYLTDNGVHIWSDWADESGELGPVYGAQWRRWNSHPTEEWRGMGPGYVKGIDQIAKVIEGIREDPYGRRHVVTAWNPTDVPKQALPPCHMMFQFEVHDGRLSCQLYQRSADMFLGVPFNIASYALLTHMVAAQTGLDVGDFIWTGGDTHIYRNHFDQVREQLSRRAYPYPTLSLAKRDSIFDYVYEDIEISGYESHPSIKGAVSV